MGRCKWFVLMLLFGICGSCKKQEMVPPQIAINNVYVEFVSANRVDVNYQLSNLGYQETGVLYYKKSNPANEVIVNAIREDGVLRLALQALDENTEYIFKVFYKQAGQQITDPKLYTVKTLSAAMSKFDIRVRDGSVIYDAEGNFTAELVGENLNELNLAKLDIKLNNVPVELDYPILQSDGSYKIVLKGSVDPVNGTRTFSGQYQGKEILFQSVAFAFGAERYWLTFNPTNIRTYPLTVFNNELYYFAGRNVNKWNAQEQRFLSVGVVPDGFNDVHKSGFEFEGQLFFPLHEITYHIEDKNDVQYFTYPVVNFYAPSTNSWTAQSFKEHEVNRRLVIENQNYFVHKGELYMSYTVSENYYDNYNQPRNSRSYIYHYNKITKRFEDQKNLGTNIYYYHIVSVNNQLYLAGLVPVYDQGLILSATFAIFKMGDQFALEEIYRAGSVNETLTIMPKAVIAYEDKILIGNSLQDFLLFDPANRQLSRVYLRQNFQHMYFGNFFRYNNKLHLNADWGFIENRTYEISIEKGR
ncbi:MAG: hypothetical protein EOO88_13430 [Pedobacter sp.]|nr:MAG: hypothetical protein EOO88_13430 [Pedobacter sp.]